MDSVTEKKSAKDILINKIIFAITVSMAAVLVTAAYGKWFYPAELLKIWDRGIGIFEILFVGFLLYGRKRGVTWIGASWVFASWGGYAYFWYQLSLPCNCMGELLHIPTGLSLGLDAFFLGCALAFAYWLGSGRKAVYWAGVLGALGLACGFFMASGIYTYSVLVNG